MPRILGYGEDALTLWLLSCQLDKLFEKLGDPSSPSDALVMYRPSFGRGGSGGDDETKTRRAEFGEFDAIVGTPQCVYLIESKWESSSEVKTSGRINLRPEQIKRHQIFQHYLSLWRTTAPLDWKAFIDHSDDNFQKKFCGKKMAPLGSRLASNLAFVLSQFGQCGADIKNVLLFFHFLEQPRATGIDTADFYFVPIRVATLPDSLYVDIALLNREMADVASKEDEGVATPEETA